MKGEADMHKVLIVEDDRDYQETFRVLLGDKVTILPAYSIMEAITLFEANTDFSAIAMDACVPGDTPTTPPLVRKFRKTFSGPIIAISSFDEYRERLVKAGCSHECEKDDLPKTLLKILGL